MLPVDPSTDGSTVFAGSAWTGGTEGAPRHARVQAIDFRRPTKFPRDLIRRLEHAHESFCRTASMGMSAELRTSVEIAVSRTEQLPYGTAMAETNQDSLIAVLDVKPLDTEMALLVEMPFALRLVDRLLGGGSGKPAEPQGSSASLTDLEIAIVRRAVNAICKPLSATWQDLAEVEFEIASMQTSPMGLQLVSPSEPVLMLILEVRMDGIVTPLTLCIPHRSVEPVIDRLEHRYQGQNRKDDDKSAGKLHAAVSGVDVELRAELGAVQMKVADVVGLEVGDVVHLRRPAEMGVVLYAGEVATYVGQAGRDSHHRAVQVSGPWKKGK